MKNTEVFIRSLWLCDVRKLFQKRKITNDVRFYRFALTNLEEADNLYNQKCERNQCGSNRNNKRPAKYCGDDSKQNADYGKLQCLSYMECSIWRIVSCEQGDYDTDGAHQIHQHGDYFVI